VWTTRFAVLSLLALQTSFRLPPLGYAVMMIGAPPHCGPQRAQWANTKGTAQRQRPDDAGHRTNDLGEVCRQGLRSAPARRSIAWQHRTLG
jgi:hypothetical protein